MKLGQKHLRYNLTEIEKYRSLTTNKFWQLNTFFCSARRKTSGTSKNRSWKFWLLKKKNPPKCPYFDSPTTLDMLSHKVQFPFQEKFPWKSKWSNFIGWKLMSSLWWRQFQPIKFLHLDFHGKFPLRGSWSWNQRRDCPKATPCLHFSYVIFGCSLYCEWSKFSI